MTKSFRVALRNNATGETRMCDGYGSWDEANCFLWVEGNNGCDCNRALHFAWAAGEPDPDCPCGETAFSALYAEEDDGIRHELDDDAILSEQPEPVSAERETGADG